MARPPDGDYFHDGMRTTHVAQGDIFREVTFVHPQNEQANFTTYGMLLHYTSNMMRGKPGTPGYAHDSRLLAPIYDFEILEGLGLTPEQLVGMRKADKMGRYMYLPPYPNAFGESGVAFHRAERFTHAEIMGTERVVQLTYSATQQVQQKLARVFFGRELDYVDPDMTDHWDPQS